MEVADEIVDNPVLTKWYSGTDQGGGCRGCAPPPPP